MPLGFVNLWDKAFPFGTSANRRRFARRFNRNRIDSEHCTALVGPNTTFTYYDSNQYNVKSNLEEGVTGTMVGNF